MAKSKKSGGTKSPRPELSIGIIFKDNIRSLERCLKALTPIRERLLCQVVMADTGSTDGSRAVAEKYADVLFDFPWTGDFSAARNAVMDHCTGLWYISVDSDEYLDKDIGELFLFLANKEGTQNVKTATVVIRNWMNYEMDGAYSDFYAIRMVRMSAGFRYQGAIHERLICGDTPVTVLGNTVFHHDGYVGLNGEQGKEKRERNLALLREKLEKEPDDPLTLLQYIESGSLEEDFTDRLRKAVAAVKEKRVGWAMFGPPILRHAVSSAVQRELPELAEWTKMAEELFPDSYYTRIDVEHVLMRKSYRQKDYEDSAHRGIRCLDAYADYRAGRGDMMGQLYSTFMWASRQAEQELRIMTAISCLSVKEHEQARQVLSELDYTALSAELVNDLTRLLRWLYSAGEPDTGALVLAAWEGIRAPKPSQARAEERERVFLQAAGAAFRPAGQTEEKRWDGFTRPSAGVFAPLAGQCEIGTAAAMLETEDTKRLDELLGMAEDWRELPAAALAHAIRQGAAFPPPGAELRLEELDALAQRLADSQAEMLELIRTAGEPEELRSLCWLRALVFAAMRSCEWRGGEADGKLARAFAGLERRFLPACYAPSALCPENLFLLPPAHRFGWYCARAFEALDGGDKAGYVRHLRDGLSSSGDMKGMVESLLTDLERQERAETVHSAPPELLELAEKVRTMLAAYPEDDPAVAALKASPVYQKVAYLIEGESV